MDGAGQLDVLTIFNSAALLKSSRKLFSRVGLHRSSRLSSRLQYVPENLQLSYVWRPAHLIVDSCGCCGSMPHIVIALLDRKTLIRALDACPWLSATTRHVKALDVARM